MPVTSEGDLTMKLCPLRETFPDEVEVVAIPERAEELSKKLKQ